jgi:hypothetical protein
MSNAFNKLTGELRESVNTPDYDPAEWVINPDLSAVDGIPLRYLKLGPDDTVVEMSASEQAAVDEALDTAAPGAMS